MAVQVLLAQTRREREKVYGFLYEIWSEEFCRSMEGMDHGNRLMRDQLDESAHHFFALDEMDRILGCVRFNILSHADLPGPLAVSMRTAELTSLFPAEEIGYASHFAVAPIARGRTVASLLIGALYRFSLQTGIRLGISYCALNNVSFYYQLGYRPYAENFRLEEGLRMPIVHCVCDRGYLGSIRSPLLRISPTDQDDGGMAAAKLSAQFPLFKTPGFAKTRPKYLWARLAFSSPSDAGREGKIWFQGLVEDELQVVQQWMSEMAIAEGEYVYRRGETERAMGVVVSGSLGVETVVCGVSRIINVILPGEPIGEVVCLGGGVHAANLVALEPTTVCLLPCDVLDRVDRVDSRLSFKLAEKLLQITGFRFANLANAAARGSVVENSMPAPTRVPSLQRAAGEEGAERIESYRFDSLGNQEKEFKRLVAQATIGEELEFSVLNRLGLAEATTVLDVGSGPGAVSLLLARHLPAATIIGIEPDAGLRNKAQALVESQGLAGRCRFLPGTGEKVPLQDDRVDFCYARFLFQHLPAPLKVLAEMRRTTRPGGRIVVLDVDDRSNMVYPSPRGMQEFEELVASVQAELGGDRLVGRKLQQYLHATGLEAVGVEVIPITADTFGRDIFFSIVYSYKQQLLERAGKLDPATSAFLSALRDRILDPATFAVTSVFVGHGVVTEEHGKSGGER